MAFYFSFLDFYTWSLLLPAILGLFITYFSGWCLSHVSLVASHVCHERLTLVLVAHGRRGPDGDHGVPVRLP